RIQGDEVLVRARVRKTEIYSGHADHDELLAWLRDRLPVRRGVMLTHGDADAIGCLRAAIAQWGDDAPHVTVPRLDETYRLTGPHPKPMKTAGPKRIDRHAEAEAIAGHDWHNDYAKLMLGVQQQLREAKTDAERRRLTRRIQRLLRYTRSFFLLQHAAEMPAAEDMHVQIRHFLIAVDTAIAQHAVAVAGHAEHARGVADRLDEIHLLLGARLGRERSEERRVGKEGRARWATYE